MAAPAHYIRSIHTSFTVAHPPSSAWSSAARGSSQLHVANHSHNEGMSHQPGHHSHHQHQHQREVLPSQQRTGSYSQGPYSYNALVHPGGGVSINTHNHHSYTHHLQNLGQPAHHHHQGYAQGGRSSSSGGQGQGYRKTPPGLTSTAGGPTAGAAGAGGRRRSVSIRVAPTSYAPPPAPPAYKFDPFADEPILPSGGSGGSGAAALSVTSPLTSSSQASKSPSPSQWSSLQLQSAEPYAEEAASATAPYTIHIPAAAPLDIQQYSPPVRPAARLRSLTPVCSPSSIPTTVASPSPSAAQAQARSTNLSKIVAGMLLNRAHSIGRPMRRRVLPRLVEGAAATGYRKSCLSSVISVEV